MRHLLVVGSVLIVCFATFALADDSADTTKAAATRKMLKQKVTVEYKDSAFREVVEDLCSQIGEKKLFIRPDTKSGVQLNTKITLMMKDVAVEEILNAVCEKNGWGYYIISNVTNAYDGHLVVKVGKERGYEAGKEPKTAKDDPDPKDKSKGKTKDKAKDKAEVKEKKDTKTDEKAEPKDKPVDDEERAERTAALKLKTAKELIADGKKDRAKQVLEDLLQKYSKTKAAEEAKELQKTLDE